MLLYIIVVWLKKVYFLPKLYKNYLYFKLSLNRPGRSKVPTIVALHYSGQAFGDACTQTTLPVVSIPDVYLSNFQTSPDLFQYICPQYKHSANVCKNN